MSVIFLLIPLSILLAVGFLLAFAWAVTSGQYEDTDTPSMRVILEEPALRAPDSVGTGFEPRPSKPVLKAGLGVGALERRWATSS